MESPRAIVLMVGPPSISKAVTSWGNLDDCGRCKGTSTFLQCWSCMRRFTKVWQNSHFGRQTHAISPSNPIQQNPWQVWGNQLFCNWHSFEWGPSDLNHIPDRPTRDQSVKSDFILQRGTWSILHVPIWAAGRGSQSFTSPRLPSQSLRFYCNRESTKDWIQIFDSWLEIFCSRVSLTLYALCVFNRPFQFIVNDASWDEEESLSYNWELRYTPKFRHLTALIFSIQIDFVLYTHWIFNWHRKRLDKILSLSIFRTPHMNLLQCWNITTWHSRLWL